MDEHRRPFRFTATRAEIEAGDHEAIRERFAREYETAWREYAATIPWWWCPACDLRFERPPFDAFRCPGCGTGGIAASPASPAEARKFLAAQDRPVDGRFVAHWRALAATDDEG